MRTSQEMSGLPHGNARQHDSVPNWLAGFFEDVAFSDGSGQARAEAEGERVKKTERDADLPKASKILWGLPADIVAGLPAHKTLEDIYDDAGSWRASNPHSFRLLYGLLIMLHGRRQVLWLGVTEHPTAEWVARQLTEACGWGRAPRYIVRDCDGVYGEIFKRRLRAMEIRDRPTARRSPWRNGHTERLIGSI
jgi:hypothetical protein